MKLKIIAAAALVVAAPTLAASQSLTPQGLSKLISLDCITKTNSSGKIKNPVAEVRLSGSQFSEGYRVTGGGCEVLGRNASLPHNPPVTASRPIEDGWSCEGGNPPNISMEFALTAHLRACRVIVKKP